MTPGWRGRIGETLRGVRLSEPLPDETTIADKIGVVLAVEWS